MIATALIIDDEPDIRELISLALGRIGLDTHTAANLEEARHLLENYSFDVCLTDMRLPDGNGVEFVKYIQSVNPELPVAVITAHGNMDAAVEAMKNGAFDFVSKPVDLGQLRRLVIQAVALGGSQEVLTPATNDSLDNEAGRDSLEALCGIDKANTKASVAKNTLVGGERLIGNSRPMEELRSLISKVARTNAPVWITGESGTGKELIARLIHDNSSRQDKPFVAINCGAIPGELMESELFGHKRGSFTGAVNDKQGLFQLADGGTLFLDEVAELPLHMQVKLLRAIQERSIRPVGSNEEISIDTRFLSASHADLAVEVDAGRFRHDLYYRLNVISIKAPSLKERSDDIAVLCQHMLARPEMKDAQGNTIAIDASAIEALEHYVFPGNVRELENLLERAVAMNETGVLGVDDLSINQAAKQTNTRPAPNGTAAGSSEVDRIREALQQTRWNRKEAAQLLGLTYRQLRYRIQQLGIDRTD